MLRPNVWPPQVQSVGTVKYIYNGKEYDSLEAVTAVIQGGGGATVAAANDTKSTVERIDKFLANKHGLIEQLFVQYAGADMKLQQHEMIGLTQVLSAQIGIDRRFFENAKEMFYRMDFDGSGHLDLQETGELIKYLLKEQRRALVPAPPGHELCNLEYKVLQQEFNLGHKLGQGGQGAVYLATHLKSSTERVVKFYDKTGGNSCLEDIKDEFELLKRLDHPNVARICEVFQDGRNIYVVSEPYKGGDLTSLVQRANERGVTVTQPWLGHVFLQIIEGISYLHAERVMHCDLKEANVMIATDSDWDAPSVVLIDFGMAKNFSGIRQGGTPGYIPPEVWQQQLWTPKGDVFALAVTFWSIYNFRQGGPFLVHDEHPFPRIQHNTLHAPMDCTRLPLGLSEIVEQMACKDFRRRPTAKEVAQSPYFANLHKMEESAPLDDSMVQGLRSAARRTSSQNMIALELSSHHNLGQMRNMNALFRKLDTDNKGTVKKTSAMDVLATVGFEQRVASRLLDALLGDDGEIHYGEFMAKMIASQETFTSSKLYEAFRSIDKDGSGTLERHEIEELMRKKHMESITEGRSVDEIMREMDKNGDGKISWEEFCEVALGQPLRAKAKTLYAKGEMVEYFSVSSGNKYIPCQIVQVDAHARVQVSVKPGYWMDLALQNKLIRKASTGGYQS